MTALERLEKSVIEFDDVINRYKAVQIQISELPETDDRNRVLEIASNMEKNAEASIKIINKLIVKREK